MTKKAIYIGDKDTFAIRYLPDISFAPTENHPYTRHYTYCHFVFGGHLIGLEDEYCYLSSWKYR